MTDLAALPLPSTVDDHRDCPVTGVLRRVGDKWSVLIISVLGAGPRRFNELHRGIEGLSHRILTRTLRGLEGDGLVSRTVFATNPVTVEYALTPLGQSLREPLTAVAEWALRHRAELEAARRD